MSTGVGSGVAVRVYGGRTVGCTVTASVGQRRRATSGDGHQRSVRRARRTGRTVLCSYNDVRRRAGLRTALRTGCRSVSYVIGHYGCVSARRRARRTGAVTGTSLYVVLQVNGCVGQRVGARASGGSYGQRVGVDRSCHDGKSAHGTGRCVRRVGQSGHGSVSCLRYVMSRRRTVSYVGYGRARTVTGTANTAYGGGARRRRIRYSWVRQVRTGHGARTATASGYDGRVSCRVSGQRRLMSAGLFTAHDDGVSGQQGMSVGGLRSVYGRSTGDGRRRTVRRRSTVGRRRTVAVTAAHGCRCRLRHARSVMYGCRRRTATVMSCYGRSRATASVHVGYVTVCHYGDGGGGARRTAASLRRRVNSAAGSYGVSCARVIQVSCQLSTVYGGARRGRGSAQARRASAHGAHGKAHGARAQGTVGYGTACTTVGWYMVYGYGTSTGQGSVRLRRRQQHGGSHDRDDGAGGSCRRTAHGGVRRARRRTARVVGDERGDGARHKRRRCRAGAGSAAHGRHYGARAAHWLLDGGRRRASASARRRGGWRTASVGGGAYGGGGARKSAAGTARKRRRGSDGLRTGGSAVVTDSRLFRASTVGRWVTVRYVDGDGRRRLGVTASAARHGWRASTVLAVGCASAASVATATGRAMFTASTTAHGMTVTTVDVRLRSAGRGYGALR